MTPHKAVLILSLFVVAFPISSLPQDIEKNCSISFEWKDLSWDGNGNDQQEFFYFGALVAEYTVSRIDIEYGEEPEWDINGHEVDTRKGPRAEQHDYSTYFEEPRVIGTFEGNEFEEVYISAFARANTSNEPSPDYGASNTEAIDLQAFCDKAFEEGEKDDKYYNLFVDFGNDEPEGFYFIFKMRILPSNVLREEIK